LVGNANAADKQSFARHILWRRVANPLTLDSSAGLGALGALSWQGESVLLIAGLDFRIL
jgi:hypothetical protein